MSLGSGSLGSLAPRARLRRSELRTPNTTSPPVSSVHFTNTEEPSSGPGRATVLRVSGEHMQGMPA